MDCRGAARGTAADRKGSSCCAPTAIARPANRGVLSPLFLGPTVAVVGKASVEIATPPFGPDGWDAGCQPSLEDSTFCPLRGLATTEEGGCRCRVGLRAPRIDPLKCDNPVTDRRPSCQPVGARGWIEGDQTCKSTPVPLHSRPNYLPIGRHGDPRRGWAEPSTAVRPYTIGRIIRRWGGRAIRAAEVPDRRSARPEGVRAIWCALRCALRRALRHNSWTNS